MPESAHAYQARHMRGSTMALPDIVMMPRRNADHIDAGLHADE
jgi:hypothetical protein